MTPLCNSIKQVLMPVSLEANRLMRESLPQGKTSKEMTDIQMFIEQGSQINVDYRRWVAQLLAKCLKNPEIAQWEKKNEVSLELFGVVSFSMMISDNCQRDIDQPYLITHAKSRYLLGLCGIEITSPHNSKKPNIASDEEVERCLDNLNAQQIRFILTDSRFQPIVAPLFEEQTELVSTDGKQVGDDDDGDSEHNLDLDGESF